MQKNKNDFEEYLKNNKLKLPFYWQMETKIINKEMAIRQGGASSDKYTVYNSLSSKCHAPHKKLSLLMNSLNKVK